MKRMSFPGALATLLFTALVPIAAIAGREAIRATGTFDPAMSIEDARDRTNARPSSPEAWHGLAYTATRDAGGPTPEAIAALLTAYEIAPYTAPMSMVWRVEYAALHWSSIPDSVQAHTLTQIEALGDIPRTWDIRASWCRTFPDGALSEAVCRVTDGAWRDGEKWSPAGR